MIITAVGDCAVQRNLPKYYDGFHKVRDFIMEGDIRFFNMETTVCENCPGTMHSGGTWLRTSKSVLRDMKEFGFNVTTPANNHCMDYTYDGFLQTIDNMTDEGFFHSGGGRNLSEASKPCYIDTPKGRVAVISCTSSYSPGAEAGEQSRDLPGRPGINPLRAKKIIYVTKDDFKHLGDIADKTKMSAYNTILVKEGYRKPDPEGVMDFCGFEFRVGEPGVKYEISKEDMRRIEKEIEVARFQADIVLISVHSHQICGDKKEEPADFLIEFSHRCIDAGANAVIGHGPHLLRPFEIYKGQPIFYCLGDFMLQLENCEVAPDDFYRKWGLKPEDGIYELFRTRTKDFKLGLCRQSEMMESVIAKFELEDGKLSSLQFMPVELGLGLPNSQIGWPREERNRGILERFSEMSRQYGVSIDEDGFANF